MSSCSDGVSSPGDTCFLTCNPGYRPTTGTPERTCQNDGSWSGTDVMCIRGE